MDAKIAVKKSDNVPGGWYILRYGQNRVVGAQATAHDVLLFRKHLQGRRRQ